jgi:predicted anti-sigma-YlaC factor YlaD
MHPSERRINDYLDGDLPPVERAEVQHHLDACADCAALARDLRAIARGAARLEPLEVPERVWPRVEAAIRRRPGPALRRWTWLAAAAALALAVAAGLRWAPGTRPAGEAPSGGEAASLGEAPAMSAELLEMERQYDEAFRSLEQVARTERAVLDEQTDAAIAQSLAVVDRAIVESRAAVAQEPSNEPAQHSLIESFKMKLSLLQDTVALINELRKADTADAPGAPGS